ncbi:MAG: hypothetical protein HAW66_03400 [Shewanella sp.]|nr:hypothetical protein [Shewanella sp.]
MSNVALAVAPRWSSLSDKQIDSIKNQSDGTKVVGLIDKVLDLLFGCHRREIKQAVHTLYHGKESTEADVFEAHRYLKSQAKSEYKSCFSTKIDSNTDRLTLGLTIQLKSPLENIEIEQSVELPEGVKQLANMCVPEHRAEGLLLACKLCYPKYESSEAVTCHEKTTAFSRLCLLIKPEHRDKLMVKCTGEDSALFQINIEGEVPKRYDVHGFEYTADAKQQSFCNDVIESMAGQKDSFNTVMSQDVPRNNYRLITADSDKDFKFDDSVSATDKLAAVKAMCDGSEFKENMLSHLATQTLATKCTEWDPELTVRGGLGENDQDKNKQEFSIIKLPSGDLLVSAFIEKHSSSENMPQMIGSMTFQKQYTFKATFLIASEQVVCLGIETQKTPFTSQSPSPY